MSADKLVFSNDPRLAARTPAALHVRERESARLEVHAATELRRMFGRSLKMRQVSAGGCDACELELGALANVNCFGIEWVASPRHADALLLSGPLTRSMQDAVRLARDAMPAPRFVIAVGACVISGGLYQGAAGVARKFLTICLPPLFTAGEPVPQVLQQRCGSPVQETAQPLS